MKKTKTKKPKCNNYRWIDLYCEQFSQKGDKPKMTVYCWDNVYEAPNAYDPGDQIKEMERDAKWLLQAAAWLKKEYKKC